MIGDEIADRDVDLVADRRDGRNAARGDGARHPFVVERRKIFARSAAAPDDHEVGAAPPIHAVECAAQLLARRVALDCRRNRDESHCRPAPAHDSDDVV